MLFSFPSLFSLIQSVGFLVFLTLFCVRVCSGFSYPFVLFMMINFVAHFLCVGRVNKMPIELAEISTKLSPYIVHVMIPEPIYDDPKSISPPFFCLEFPL